MYKLVFLLIFSAANATGAKDITLDIDIISKTETSCHVTPNGTQILTKGEHIRFHIQTPTKLNDFWCYQKDKLVYNYSVYKLTEHTKNQTIRMYKLAETSTDSESDMEGNWTCTYQIFKKESIKEKHESTCLFQVKVTNKPGVSLKIADLSPLSTWNNGTKLYNYNFTEGEETFDCILANPTEKEENYTVYFKLDGSLHKRLPRVILKPLSKVNLTDVFKLNDTSKHIVCSAVNVKGDGPNLRANINLQYIPPPRVHLFTYGPRGLKTGELFWKNNTQIYHYEFTDREEVTITCALNDTGGSEGHYEYVLRLCMKNCEVSKESETSISDTFKLEKEDRFIYCTAFNKEATTDLSLPKYLQNVVHLRHTQHEDTVATAPPQLNIAGSVTLQRWNDKIYHYNFTDGETIDLNCSLKDAADFEKNYDIAFYNQTNLVASSKAQSVTGKKAKFNLQDFITCTVTAEANSRAVSGDNVDTLDKSTKFFSERFQRSTTHVWHNFTLNKTSKTISCAAFGDTVEKSRIVVHLHYNPQPTQDFTFYVNGSSEPEDEISYHSNLTQIYSYKFTDDENITVTLGVNDGNNDTYDIEVYLEGNISRREPKASGVDLTIEGLPNDSCYNKLLFTKTCNYTYDQDRIRMLSLKCVLGGTTEEDSVWTVKFGTYTRKATFKKDGSSPIIVPYDIPLNSENNTVTCNATKNTSTKTMTIYVNIHYIPKSTTSTTTTTMEPTTAQTIQSTEPPQVNLTPVSQSSGEEESSSMEWLKYVLGAGALLIAICIVVGCLVMCRQKKPLPADSTYANLTKDQSKATPTPAPRTIQKTNDGQKPNAERKPNVAVENNYSEPKDSQDMSEALYADPNRFVGDSSNYAEPYFAKPTPPRDTYAEPYKSNYAEPYSCTSEGNYAELNLPDCSGKELYAKPIPKAQRKPKLKDDCNYSNVFGGQYGNTKK